MYLHIYVFFPSWAQRYKDRNYLKPYSNIFTQLMTRSHEILMFVSKNISNNVGWHKPQLYNQHEYN